MFAVIPVVQKAH